MIKNFRHFTHYSNLFNEVADKDLIITGERTESDIEFLKDIGETHIFEMDNKIKNLLLLTKTPKDNNELRLPFNNMFLEISISPEELGCKVHPKMKEIMGILINQRDEIVDGYKFIQISAICLIKEKDTFTFFTRLIHVESDEAKSEITEDKEVNKMFNEKMGKKIESFCINLLNFVNNPEIEIETDFRSEKNINLKKNRGQPVFSSTSKIILSGNLKRQLEKMDGVGYEFNHKFWVRGHFCRYHTNEGVVVKWILPYIKGKGILIQKVYKLKNSQLRGKVTK